jgi:hypothetical protein
MPAPWSDNPGGRVASSGSRLPTSELREHRRAGHDRADQITLSSLALSVPVLSGVPA